MRQIGICFLLLTSFLINSTVFAQTISREDFLSVIPFLQKEDFSGAFEATKTLLEKDKDKSSELRPIVTYMNIFSGAVMVSKGELSHEQFAQHVRQFEGQKVMLS